jgi:glycosyltransferase involved in cell wall biosynthesis
MESPKMRIALIAPPWGAIPPIGYGGIELVVDRLATGFQREGHEVLLFTTGDSTCPVPRQWALPEAEGDRIGTVVPALRHVMAAYEAVQDFDIVHDHTLAGPVYAERHHDLKVVTTIHGPLDGELGDPYLRIADRVPLIAISRAQCRPLPQLPVARVIHHGLDVADFPAGEGDGGYVLFLGRMTPDKGVHLAIEAADKAGVPLLIAAKMREPAEIDYFKREVEPYLSDSIQYVGEASNSGKLELLAGARALLFPICWNEPFGMVMIEAMACGTPVLAFAEGSVPEVVNHGRTGFICADVAEMADAIGESDRLDRAECRGEVADGRFSTGRMVREHLSLFEELVGSR